MSDKFERFERFERLRENLKSTGTISEEEYNRLEKLANNDSKRCKVKLIIDESAKEWIKKMMDWSEEDWNRNTITEEELKRPLFGLPRKTKQEENLSDEHYKIKKNILKNLKDIDGTTIIEYGEGFMTFETTSIEQAIFDAIQETRIQDGVEINRWKSYAAELEETLKQAENKLCHSMLGGKIFSEEEIKRKVCEKLKEEGLYRDFGDARIADPAIRMAISETKLELSREKPYDEEKARELDKSIIADLQKKERDAWNERAEALQQIKIMKEQMKDAERKTAELLKETGKIKEAV